MERRLLSLSNTSIPAKFEAAFVIYCYDAHEAEAVAHSVLAAVRITPGREFFEIDAAEAERLVRRELEHRGLIAPPPVKPVPIPPWKARIPSRLQEELERDQRVLARWPGSYVSLQTVLCSSCACSYTDQVFPYGFAVICGTDASSTRVHKAADGDRCIVLPPAYFYAGEEGDRLDLSVDYLRATQEKAICDLLLACESYGWQYDLPDETHLEEFDVRRMRRIANAMGIAELAERWLHTARFSSRFREDFRYISWRDRLRTLADLTDDRKSPLSP